MRYRNAAHAFAAEIRAIREGGLPVTVRGSATHEILARSITLEEPAERFITVPGRGNDAFATIAETMWVLAGRDDVEFLSRYLKRAALFSDDQKTWRGAYGPRLRAWYGTDQIDAVRTRLTGDPTSRRAVAVLFDPARDQDAGLDVPCNNWLHFLLRDGSLDLHVAVRSNDILWGFSGINTFEWSVLHEMMAFWLGSQVGRATYFVSSMHLYDERVAQADRALAGFDGSSGYEDGWEGARFATPWQEFDAVLRSWFEIEERLARGADCSASIEEFPDPMLREFLRAISIKWAIEGGADERRQREMVDGLGHSDVAFTLREQLFRDSRSLKTRRPAKTILAELRPPIAALHRSKHAAYGDSWKRRGEVMGIAANLARKVDRIEQVATGAPAGREALLDTAIDLLVYALKYETFIADKSPEVAALMFGDVEDGFSDDPQYVDRLLAVRGDPRTPRTLTEEAAAVGAAFADLEASFQGGYPVPWTEKHRLAERLSDAAIVFVIAVAMSDAAGVEALKSAFPSP